MLRSRTDKEVEPENTEDLNLGTQKIFFFNSVYTDDDKDEERNKE